MRPLTRTSTGLCFLSRLHDDEIGRITRRINIDIMDADFRRSEADVLADVNTMRRDGYFHADGFMEPGVASIAKMVENGNDATPLAIAVGGRTENLAEKKDMILEAIDELRDTLSTGSAISPSSDQKSAIFQRMHDLIED